MTKVKEYFMALTTMGNSKALTTMGYSKALTAKETFKALTIKGNSDSLTTKGNSEALTTKGNSKALTTKEMSSKVSICNQTELNLTTAKLLKYFHTCFSYSTDQQNFRWLSAYYVMLYKLTKYTVTTRP